MTSCSFNATLPGAGDFVVASAAVGGTTPEQSNVADGKVYSYYAQSFDFFGNVTGWEAGSGIYTVSTHTLKRTTITANSDGSSFPVNFPLAPIVGMYPSAANTLEPALGAVMVWASFTGATGVVQDSFNVSGIVRSSAGVYIISFIKPFATNLYSCNVNNNSQLLSNTTSGSRLVGSVGVTFATPALTATDPATGFFQAFGRQ